MNSAIAARLDVDVGVVSRWRKRYRTEGLAGLKDRKRSGRPRALAAEVVAEVKAMVGQPPAARAVPPAPSSPGLQIATDNGYRGPPSLAWTQEPTPADGRP